MATIHSKWSNTTPPLTGQLLEHDWSGSAIMPIPLGTFLARNNATHLFIGLDLTEETTPPPTQPVPPPVYTADPIDCFTFLLNLSGSGVFETNNIKFFTIADFPPTQLCEGTILTPETATQGATTTNQANSPVSQTSSLKQFFGPSLNSPANHVQWQISFLLSDLGINFPLNQTPPAPIVHFGLAIAIAGSQIGATPVDPYRYFNDYNKLILAQPTSIHHVIIPPGGGRPTVVFEGAFGAVWVIPGDSGQTIYINDQNPDVGGQLGNVGPQRQPPNAPGSRI